MNTKNGELTTSLANWATNNIASFKLLNQGQLAKWTIEDSEVYPEEFEVAVNLSGDYSIQDITTGFIQKFNTLLNSKSCLTMRHINSITDGDYTYMYTRVSIFNPPESIQ